MYVVIFNCLEDIKMKVQTSFIIEGNIVDEVFKKGSQTL